MYNPVETIRIDKRNKNFLIQLKRKTQIQNWNTLCRWGFLYSLQLKEIPNKVVTQEDGAIEMSWKVFAGVYSNLIWALLKRRILNDRIDITDDNLKEHFKRHLYRGIQALTNLEADKAIGLVLETMPHTSVEHQLDLL